MAGENINRRINIFINGKEVEDSLSGITAAKRKTINELGRLVRGTEGYNERLAELTARLTDLNERQTEFREELQLNNREMGAARENFTNLLGGLATGDMQAVQNSLLGIRGSIVATTQAAWAFVTTPVGAFVAGLVAFSAAAKFIWDYNAGLTEMNNKLSSLGVGSESLSKVRSEVQATAETFDKEFNDIAEKANSLAKTYSISISEANDIIAKGLANGGAQNNEFLDSLGEYDEFFAKAGYSAQQFIDVINTGYDLGIYQDKLPDALKEADLSLKEQTKTTRDALINAFGAPFTDEILKKVRTGEMTTKEALEAIAVKSKETGLSQQQQAQLTADVFKGAGEDAGGSLKILEAVAASTKKNMSESAKATDELRLANEHLNEVQSEMFEVDGFADSWTKLKTAGIEAFAVFLEEMSEFKTEIEPLIDLVGVVLYGAWESVKFVFLSTVEICRGGFQLLGKIVSTFTQFFYKLFTEGPVSALKVLGNGLLDVGKIVGNVFIGIKNTILSTLSNIVDIASPMLKALGLDIDKIKKKLESWKSAKFEISGTVKNDDPKKPTGSSPRVLSKDSGNIDANKEAADTAKKREKAVSDAKKHSEDLLKAENDLQKQLNESRAKAAELKFGLIKDDYAREKALINAEFDKKIEDLTLNIKKEQEAIDKLKSGISNPKTNNEDLISFKKQLKDRLEIQENHNQTMLFTDQTRDLKLGALQEKYLQKNIQDQEKKNASDLLNLRTRHNNELAELTTLEEAKKMLSATLSADELAQIHSLDDAKKELKKKQLKEEYDLQLNYLNSLVKEYGELLDGQSVDGFKILTAEQRDEIVANLDTVKNKISELNLSKKGTEDVPDPSEDIKSLNGLDILGFTPEQWQNTFESLDKFSEKIAAVELTIGAVKNAFGLYFQFLEAGEKRALQKFESANRQKTNELNIQLEKGYITQEVYTARKAKLDADLAKKKAELEYKQAKREKLMNVANIITNTAVGVSKALAQGGMILGIPFAAVVGALGAVQLASALAQPLPEKGFYNGGYTGNGNPKGEAGPVHFNEYVIPEKVLFSNDPVVPNIVGYLEQKRQGKQPISQNSSGDNTSQSPTSNQSSQNDSATAAVLIRLIDVIEEIKEEGIQAWLVNDYAAAKKIRDKIKEVTKNETNAKP